MWNLARLCSQNSILFSGTVFKWRLCSKIIEVPIKKPTISNKWYDFARKKVKLKTDNSTIFYITIGAGFATFCGIKTLSSHAVCCEAKTERQTGTRLVGIHALTEEPEFKWHILWELLKPYSWELAGALCAALICALLNIYIPRVLGSLIDVLSEMARSTTHFYEATKLPAVKILALYTLHSIFTFIYIALLANVGEGISKTLKVLLFTSVMRQDISFFDEYRTGEILSRLTIDINDFKSCFKMVVAQGLRNCTQIIGCSVTLFFISPHMTATMIVAVPTVILAGSLVGVLLRNISYKAKAQNTKVALVAEEAISNIRTVRSFAMEDLENRMFTAEATLCRDLNVSLGHGIALFQAGTNLFLNGMVLSTIYMGGYMLSAGKITPGDLMAFLVALQILQRSFTQLSLLFGSYIKGKHAGARVFEMLELEPHMKLNRGKTIPYHSFVPKVELKNVKFAYPRRPQQPVLKDVTITIPAGQTVAVVGPSGSGKSTIAWLVERLYDVDDGHILIGGHDIKYLNPTWLRGRAIGFISQEPVLFATTVMENIRYGKPGATDEEVYEAARLANADVFIQQFPDKYNTLVGERGASVSGGQKQRIAIARALLKNPAILILDEATSALDTESEKMVQNALDNVIKSRTTIVIAHRLSTIKNADIIVVLHNGSVIETGNHDELMAKKGMYASLVLQQQLSGDSKSD